MIYHPKDLKFCRSKKSFVEPPVRLFLITASNADSPIRLWKGIAFWHDAPGYYFTRVPRSNYFLAVYNRLFNTRGN